MHNGYTLPAWGPMLVKSSLQRLRRLLTLGDRITAGLRKYDHISVESQIEYHSLCAIHRQYSSHQCVPIDPPIVFGTQYSYSTRSSERFANIYCCRRTQHSENSDMMPYNHTHSIITHFRLLRVNSNFIRGSRSKRKLGGYSNWIIKVALSTALLG